MGDVYIVQPSELTAVADAIREKGETSAQLVFPGGFVSAIQDISGGGLELNFEIVGGTTQPSDPKENTIWVNTGTEITGWVFSPEKPTNPAEGVVWIQTGMVSQVSFDAVADNDLILCPIGCMQYVNGAFVYKTALTYMNGQWKQWGIFLFASGDLCEDITGGWNSQFTIASSWIHALLNLNATNMEGTITNSSSSKIYITYRCTTNAINASGKTVKMRYSLNVEVGEVGVYLRLYSALSSSAALGYRGGQHTASIENDIISFDASTITSPVYVMCNIQATGETAKGTLTVHDIWLE